MSAARPTRTMTTVPAFVSFPPPGFPASSQGKRQRPFVSLHQEPHTRRFIARTLTWLLPHPGFSRSPQLGLGALRVWPHRLTPAPAPPQPSLSLSGVAGTRAGLAHCPARRRGWRAAGPGEGDFAVHHLPPCPPPPGGGSLGISSLRRALATDLQSSADPTLSSPRIEGPGLIWGAAHWRG